MSLAQWTLVFAAAGVVAWSRVQLTRMLNVGVPGSLVGEIHSRRSEDSPVMYHLFLCPGTTDHLACHHTALSKQGRRA